MEPPHATTFEDLKFPAEKGAVLRSTSKTSSHHRRSSTSLKNLCFAIFGCSVALVFLLTKCLPDALVEWQTDDYHPTTLSLVKHSVAASSATPSSTAVLECFQVAEPVLTPSVTDGSTSDNESEITIPPSKAANSCEVTLMAHTFAYSYGMPFVGKFTLDMI